MVTIRRFVTLMRAIIQGFIIELMYIQLRKSGEKLTLEHNPRFFYIQEVVTPNT